MKKTLSISAFILLFSFRAAHAVCPVCTVAVGAGLGLAEWLGIDDSISGLWIGALIVSMSIWTINWLSKKNIRFKGRKILIFLGYYAIVVVPLWKKGFIGQPYNKLCGLDKLLFGVVIGSLLFAAAIPLHTFLRKRNKEKSYFQGQKIAIPIAMLMVASLVLYYSC